LIARNEWTRQVELKNLLFHSEVQPALNKN